MKRVVEFRSRHLTGRPPAAEDAGVYSRLFGRAGLQELDRNLHDYERHRIAPWTLSSEGSDVGVGGFRLGFGQDEGMELVLALLPRALPVGLAAEFLADALLFVVSALRADRVFCLADGDTALSPRMLQEAGFTDAGTLPGPLNPARRLMRWSAASPPAA